jgi:cysteine-rich repeat protein
MTTEGTVISDARPRVAAAPRLVAARLPTAGRARIAAGILALSVLLGITGARHAYAVCGDGELDAGEMCDDGNLADGDCCTSSCQRPDYCYATDHASIILRDRTDDRDDRLFWKYYRGPNTFEEWGDPTTVTSYSLCVWDDDRLVIQSRVNEGGLCHPMRRCWKTLGRVEPQAYKYFNKPGNDTGIQRVFVASRKPPQKGYINVRSLGTEINPPGPVGFDQYFNQTDAVRVQFLRNDAPVCWEAAFTDNKKNKFKLFKSFLRD